MTKHKVDKKKWVKQLAANKPESRAETMPNEESAKEADRAWQEKPSGRADDWRQIQKD